MKLKSQNPLPEGSWHTWYVIDIGNGFTDYKKYIEGPYEDLYCFPTIKSNDNCIVKKYLIVVLMNILTVILIFLLLITMSIN